MVSILCLLGPDCATMQETDLWPPVSLSPTAQRGAIQQHLNQRNMYQSILSFEDSIKGLVGS